MIAMTFDDDAKPEEFMVKFQSSLPLVKGLNNPSEITIQGMKNPKDEVLIDKPIDELAFGMEYSPDHLKEIKKTFDNRVIADNIRTSLSKKEIDEELNTIEKELNAFRPEISEKKEGYIESQKSNGTDLKNNSLNRMLELMRKKNNVQQYQLGIENNKLNLNCNENQYNLNCNDERLNLNCNDERLNLNCNDERLNLNCNENQYNLNCNENQYNLNCNENQYNLNCNENQYNLNSDYDQVSTRKISTDSSNRMNYQSEDSFLRAQYNEAGCNKSIQTLLGDQPDYEKVRIIEQEIKKWKLQSNGSIEVPSVFQPLQSLSSENNAQISQVDNTPNYSGSFSDSSIKSHNILQAETIEESCEIKFPKRYQSNKMSKEPPTSKLESNRIQPLTREINQMNPQFMGSPTPKQKRAPMNKFGMQNKPEHQDESINPINRVNSLPNNAVPNVSVKIPNRLTMDKNPLNRLTPAVTPYPGPDFDENYISNVNNGNKNIEENAIIPKNIQTQNISHGYYKPFEWYDSCEYQEGLNENVSPDMNKNNKSIQVHSFDNKNIHYNTSHSFQSQCSGGHYYYPGMPIQESEPYPKTYGMATTPMIPPSNSQFEYGNGYYQGYNSNSSLDANRIPQNPNIYYQRNQTQSENYSNYGFINGNSDVQAVNPAYIVSNADQELNESDLNYLISKDSVKRKLLMMLSDGSWHNEYELIRVLKKERTMGFISFGVIIESINEEVHSMFINVGKSENQTTQYRINPKHLSILKKSLATYDYT